MIPSPLWHAFAQVGMPQMPSHIIIFIWVIVSGEKFKMTEKRCPLCQKNAYVYSTCFDCKQPIQWVCYTCQWESNLRDHSVCHKNVLLNIA